MRLPLTRCNWFPRRAADPGQQPATLGEDEQLRSAVRGTPGVDAGSPWLWLALGGVVVALLVIVARLLPQSAGLSDKPDGAG